MKITELNLENVFIIKPSSRSDFRGDFKRLYSSKNLKIHKLKFNLKQINLSNNFVKGTIRGLHYFDIRKKEFKIVNCPKGSIFDLILDVRKNSKTYGKLFSIELNERNKWSIIIPPGVAHGYQTLKKNSLVYYFTSSYYDEKYDYGINPLDKFLAIKWPIKKYVISKRDKNHKNFEEINS